MDNHERQQLITELGEMTMAAVAITTSEFKMGNGVILFPAPLAMIHELQEAKPDWESWRPVVVDLVRAMISEATDDDPLRTKEESNGTEPSDDTRPPDQGGPAGDDGERNPHPAVSAEAPTDGDGGDAGARDDVDAGEASAERGEGR